jgi:hypothetical protein
VGVVVPNPFGDAYLDDPHTTKAQDHLDHCIAVLWKLTH